MNNSHSLYWKEIILGLLSACLGFFVFRLWHELTPLIIAGELKTHSFTLPLVGLMVTASLFSLSALFAKNKWVAYISAIINTGAVYFVDRPVVALAVSFLLTVLLTMFSVYRIRREHNLAIGFSASKILKSGLPIYFTAVALMISIFYFQAARVDQSKTLSSLFPKSASNLVFKALSGRIESLLGLPIKISPEMSVNDVLLKFVTAQSKEGGIAVDKLSKNDLNKLLAAQRQEMARRYNISLNPDEKVSDVFYTVVSRRFQNLVGPYNTYLPFVSAFAFFFAFKTFTIPLYYVTLLVNFLFINCAIFAKIL